MFDAKVCEIICIGLKVMLKNVPRNVASLTLSRHFYLIANFKVTMRKYMPLYNLKGSFNRNRKHTSSVKPCSINKLTLYIICKMHYNKLWCGFFSL